MKIIIDQQDDLIQLKEDYNPTNICEQIESTLHSSGKVIQNSYLNDEKLSLEVIQEKINQNAHADWNIKIETGSLREHLFGILDDISSSLNKTEEETISISEEFLNIDPSKALDRLANWCTDIHGLVQNIVSMIKLFRIDVSELQISSKPFNQSLEEIQNFLQEINNAIEKDDRTTIADLLEFEISSLITGLKDIFPTFKSRLQEVLS